MLLRRLARVSRDSAHNRHRASLTAVTCPQADEPDSHDGPRVALMAGFVSIVQGPLDAVSSAWLDLSFHLDHKQLPSTPAGHASEPVMPSYWVS